MTSKPAAEQIVPSGFDVPTTLVTDHTVLRPLGAEHNRSDYAAWTSSIEHIRATPGFGPDRSWPDPGLTLDQNLADLKMHRRHFAERVGFTYTVLDRDRPDRVVGCVYIYPDPIGDHSVEVRSWVVSDRPELDVEVWRAVRDWLDSDWPFESFRYESRTA